MIAGDCRLADTLLMDALLMGVEDIADVILRHTAADEMDEVEALRVAHEFWGRVLEVVRAGAFSEDKEGGE